MSFPVIEFGELVSLESFLDAGVDDGWGIAVAGEADDGCDRDANLIDG